MARPSLEEPHVDLAPLLDRAAAVDTVWNIVFAAVLVVIAFGRTGGKRLVEESSARAIELQTQDDDARRTAGAGT
jgi:hypothetical protein